MLGQLVLNSVLVNVMNRLWGTMELGPYYQIVMCHSNEPGSERPL